jgi:hypothetical protein
MQLMWFPLVKSTLDYLESIPEVNARYNIGILGNLPGGDKNKKSTIEIDWDNESGAADIVNTVGEVVLYLLIKNRADEIDMMQAYQEQYEMQNLILEKTKLLHDYILRNLKIAVKISAAGVAPLGKLTRPYYSNQLVIVFEWKK